MFSKFELIGAGICVGLMATALYLIQVQATFGQGTTPQTATVIDTGVIVVTDTNKQVQAAALREASDNKGNLERMVINEIKIGAGAEVKEGDVVSVHYVGRLQDGTEFDNSKKRGAAFEFQVGGGQVIKGWEEGLLGMHVGGERILVIPPEKGYGDRGVGPIPGGATLVFSIELLEIK